MDRADATGLGASVAGHAALLAVLTLGLASVSREIPRQQPIEVAFVDEVALDAKAPSQEAPAPSIAPELGPPEEAAPEPEPLPEPEPAPLPPRPAPEPLPKPKAVVPPEPKPAPKAAPKAQPKSQPKAAPKAAAKAAPKQPASKAKQTAGSLLGRDFLKGIGSDPAPAKGQQPAAAAMSTAAASNIAGLIQRQIQPCADRQVNPGPGANRITTTINLRLNQDGSLASAPRVVRQSGVTDENRRYAERVADLAIATFKGCSPLRGLPAELYDVPRGWRSFTMNYKLPG